MTTTKKTTTKKPAAKKTTTAKKAATAKKTVAKKAPAKKAPVKKAAPKKATATAKTTVKKTVAQKPVVKKLVDPNTGVKTMGHEWDGIQEYNNPLPRWWLWCFYISIVWAIGYCIYYPAIPLLNSFTEGTAGWSQYKELQDAKDKAAEKQEGFNNAITTRSVEQVLADPELANFAIAAGKAQFALHCSQCHGSGAAGAKGYPNLLDDEWIWGGRIEDIVYTITHGIRSYDSDETRDNVMAAYGKDEMLTAQEIADVTRYIKVISQDFLENDASERGMTIFQENCTSCHGENGEGMQEMGAPALNNDVWLYGGHSNDIIESLNNGRAGMMPAFGQKLNESDIKKLAAYVYSLSGGEK